MGLPVGTGMRSPLTPSPNMSGRGLVVALAHVGTTASVLSTSPVGMKAFPVETPSNPQYPLPKPMLYDRYPPPDTFVLPLSGYMPCFGCDPAIGGDPLSCKSAIMTQLTSILAWVRGSVVEGIYPDTSRLGTLFLRGSWFPSLLVPVLRIVVLTGTPSGNG